MKRPDKPEPGDAIDLLAAKRILVANDFSPESIRAFMTGFKFAQRTGAELIILNVEETPAFPWGGRGGIDLREQECHHERSRSLIRQILAEHIQPILKGCFPNVTILAVDGDPATEIVKAAFDCHADLILVASDGKTGPARILMGDTAAKVARFASCPVLVVRSRKHELDQPPPSTAPRGLSA